MKKKAEITKEFIDKINELIENKFFRNRRDVVDKLKWGEVPLSLVMSGKRPVPEEKVLMLEKLIKNEKLSSNIVDEGTPIYELSATASQMDNIGQLPEVPTFHVKIPGYEDCNFGMYVFGHSMYPTIETGSLVLCRKIHDKTVIMYGEIYLIRTKQIIIHSAVGKNKKQLPVEIPKSFIAEIKALKLDKLPADWYWFGKGYKPGPHKMKRNTVSEHHGEMLDIAKLDRKKYSLYGWKHTGNVDSYLAGVDIYDLMRQNRHHSIAQTEQYLQSLGLRPNINYSNKAPKL